MNVSAVEVKWDDAKIKTAIKKQMYIAIADSLEYVLQEVNEDVPFDTGALMRSGNYDISVESNQGTGHVFYDTPYAIKVHEHPEYHFQNGRKGKYLEDVVERVRDEIRDFIKSRFSLAFR